MKLDAESLKAAARARLADARTNPLFWRGVALFIAVVALDQATKMWILHGLALAPGQSIDLSSVFDLTYVQNTGVSFGLLSGGWARWILTVFSVAVAAGLLVWLTEARRLLPALGVGLIAGGAFGNAIDRFFYGYVVDFLDFSGLGFVWVFNVADAGINVGVAALILDAILHREDGAAGFDAPPGDRVHDQSSKGSQQDRRV
ncbi:MAG: signal peptidase II [Pseudomonadota bacterium]